MDQTNNQPVLTQAFLIVGVYMLVRSLIYYFMPHTSLESWFYRDCWMTLPRFTAFCVLVFMDRYFWKSTPFDFDFRGIGKASLYGGILLIVYIFYLSGSRGNPWPGNMILGAMFTTPFVGLWEECAFRGVILGNLIKRYSVLFSVLGSSALFTVFHFQAQSLSEWPGIFITGVIFANLRIRGLSIWWLVVIHTAIDVGYFFFGTSMPDVLGSRHMLFLGGLLLYAVFTYPKERNLKRTFL